MNEWFKLSKKQPKNLKNFIKNQDLGQDLIEILIEILNEDFFSLRTSMRISLRSCPRSWFLMMFLVSFLSLNEVLAQDLIKILILEQSHWDFDEKNILFHEGRNHLSK